MIRHCTGRAVGFLALPECKESVKFQRDIMMMTQDGIDAGHGCRFGGVAGRPATGDDDAGSMFGCSICRVRTADRGNNLVRDADPT